MHLTKKCVFFVSEKHVITQNSTASVTVVTRPGKANLFVIFPTTKNLTKPSKNPQSIDHFNLLDI